MDTDSAEGLLAALTDIPANSFGKSLGAARAALPRIQVREKADLSAAFPQVERPTGLPRHHQRPVSASIRLFATAAPDMQGVAGRGHEPTKTRAITAAGPVPGSDLPTIASEPVVGEEDSGSWWNWLSVRVSGFVSRLPTSDPGLSISAGPRPALDLTGEADRSQSDRHQQTSYGAVTAQRAQADTAAAADFGTNDIYPTAREEQLRPSYKPTAPTGVRSPSRIAVPSIPAEARAAFDEHVASSVSGKVDEQLAQYRLDRANYQTRNAKTRAEGERRIAQEAQRTRTEQEGIRRQARDEVEARRELWHVENRRIHENYATHSQAKRAELDDQISKRVQTAELRADQELTSAEGRAEAERVAAETRAAEERRIAENRPRSWWERFKGAVSDAFSAMKKVVNDIFDALRRRVQQIIEAAKTLVRGILEAARAAIVGFIKVFGEAIKGLVSIALAAFPEAAARAKQWIDGRVDAAVNAVDQAAEALKATTDAILNWVGQTMDAALRGLQAAVIFALDTLEVLALALARALELLAKLLQLIAKIGPLAERITALIKDPSPVIEAIKGFLAGLIAQIPTLAETTAKDAITFSPLPKDHWEGIWRHLKPRLDYLAANWWEIIKDTAWLMLWPFGKDSSGKRPLFEHVQELYHVIGDTLTAIWNLDLNAAIDKGLRSEQLWLSIIGLFYGWVFLGLVIAGGILGAEVGVLPGMAAGAAIAGEIGLALTVSTVAVETTILVKSGYDLVFGSNTPDEDEQDYELVANSGLTIAIMGVLALLGAAAARIARYIIRRVAGLVWRRPVLRGRGKTPRGDVIEVRVASSQQVIGLLRRNAVTWLESIRKNFPVIDLLEGGQIIEIPRPGRASLWRVTGGRLISVKSTSQIGRAAQSEIVGWIDKLSEFSTVQNVSVVNPSGRTLIVAVQNPLEESVVTALRNHAASKGVLLDLTSHLPPNHPAVVFPDQLPAILREAGVVAADQTTDYRRGKRDE